MLVFPAALVLYHKTACSYSQHVKSRSSELLTPISELEKAIVLFESTTSKDGEDEPQKYVFSTLALVATVNQETQT